MSDTQSQDSWSLSVSTSLGTDALLLTTLTGTEALSEPFVFDLTMGMSSADLDIESLIGEAIAVTLTGGTGVTRNIHGRLYSALHDGRRCQGQIRPWLSLLEHASDNRIFQTQAIPDIITAVFDDAGFSDYKLSLTSSYSQLDYCVQFGETSFNFVHRLMQEAGIGYFFEHTSSAHTLVLFDDVSACSALSSGGTVPLLPVPPQATFMEDNRIQAFSQRLSAGTGKYQTDDYNFETPSTDLKASVGDSGLQIYDYPGRYTLKDDGDSVAKVRLEALEAPLSLVEGVSPLRTMTPGYTFTLEDHPTSALNAEYLIRRVEHRAERREYVNEFSAQAKATPYRPPMTATKPRIPGSQTAVVVGKSGEEIWSDQYARIKVQFHWDQLGTKDENSSCWIRVAQPWAGASWGHVVLPRIGQEVVVSFLNGDPDRPLITGVVYNGENSPPYTLPDNQTRMVIKSNSSTGGGGFNELYFEDKKDSELVYMHAQKDMTLDVLNDRTETITQNDSLTVSEGNRTIAVSKGNETHSVKGTRSLTVTDNETRTYEADVSETISGKLTIKVTGDISIETDGAMRLKSGGDMTLEAGGNMTLDAGGSMTVSAGSSMDISSGTGLTGKAGTALDLQGGTTMSVKGSASGTVDGGGTLTVKGGMINLN
jgi:type VI secretion system secreted protein VgrG